MSDSCFQRDALLGYLHGKTAEAETANVENHIAGCPKCQILLEILSEESDSLMYGIADAVKNPLVVGVVGSECRSGLPALDLDASCSSSAGAPNRPVLSSTMIRDYRILECIGQGGMGSVYRALHVRLNRYVAVKILKRERMGSPEAVSRFAREMRLLAQLEHGHIVRALDAGEQDGLPYFVMEFVTGVNLHQLVRRLGPLPVVEACFIARLAASALQYAHEQKVIHRDVKPSNVMLTSTGNVKLLDLGLAQILEMDGDEAVSRADQVLGTLAYMSPEQLSGRHQVTLQSDIFSLGVTLHELLTGQRPHGIPGRPTQLLDVQALRPDIDEELLALMRDMLAATPSQRPLSMTVVESRLQTFAPAADLASLMAEYYRWNNRGGPQVGLEIAKADTEPGSVRPTDSQSAPATSDPKKTAVHNLPIAAWKYARSVSWLPTLALVGTVSAAAWMTSKPAQKQLVTPTAVQVDTTGDVVPQLLADGCIALQRAATGERYDLMSGRMELLAGKYKLCFSGPEQFQEDGADIEISPASTQRLRLTATLTKAFQFPDLPALGANATYHGTIWREGWSEPERPMPYKLYLEVLAVETPPGLPATKWLQVEFYNQRDGYTETAYLKLDSKRWDTQRQLEIVEGWSVAKSAAIERFIVERGQAAAGKDLVVRFDRQRDLLGEIDSAPLPEQRLSAQDVVTLFFGEEMDANAPPIRMARALLSQGETHQWLGPTRDATAPVACYIVSSRKKEDDAAVAGYRLARRTSDRYNPFGLVELQVNTSFLNAECRMKHASILESESPETERMLEQFRRNEFDPSIVVAARTPATPNAAAASTLAVEPVLQAPDNSATAAEPRLTAPESAIDPVEVALLEVPPSVLDFLKWIAQIAFRESAANDNLESMPSQAPLPNSVASAISAGSPPTLSPAPTPLESSPTTKRFDLASIPGEPSSITYQGIISQGPAQSEAVSATVRMLGTEKIDDQNYRWLEVEIASMMDGERDYWEAARVLMDADAYDHSQQFLIRQGWVAYGNRENVFAMPGDGNLNALVDTRLQLQEKLRRERTGVIDVLSMLFNANLKPRTRISALRAKIAGKFSGMNRLSKLETRRLKFGENLAGELWRSPISLPNQLDYAFFRSEQIPFGFVAARLDLLGLSISLEVDSKGGPADFSSSVFGTPTVLNELLNNNRKRVPAVQNWRVWTWIHAEKTYKAWAEFGGTITAATGRDVLLRDRGGRETRVPEHLLSEPDSKFVKDGRYWPSFKNQRRVLVVDNERNQTLVFDIPSTGSRTSHLGGLTELADQTWLQKLRTASKLQPTTSANIQAWSEFAGYLQ